MLIVAGVFEMEPADREAFLAGREEAMRISRGEQGCQAYVFSADPLEPGRVHLFEIWDSEADLAAHLSAMRARGGPPATVAVRSSQITKYEVASSTVL